MKGKGLFVAHPGGFTPYDENARKVLNKLLLKHADRPVFMSVRTARNPEFSAMAHVVFGKLADGLGVPMDAVKQFLKEATGRFDVVRMPNGTLQKLHHSVSFESMTEEQFRAFWNDALPIILERLLGGVRSDVYDDIVNIISGKGDHRG